MSLQSTSKPPCIGRQQRALYLHDICPGVTAVHHRYVRLHASDYYWGGILEYVLWSFARNVDVQPPRGALWSQLKEWDRGWRDAEKYAEYAGYEWYIQLMKECNG